MNVVAEIYSFEIFAFCFRNSVGEKYTNAINCERGINYIIVEPKNASVVESISFSFRKPESYA